jgi:hypothetical protein
MISRDFFSVANNLGDSVAFNLESDTEGEFQAAEKLVQAARMISEQPIALQLRYLQTMKEISSEHNTTTFLPIPMDLFAPFFKESEPAKSTRIPMSSDDA